MVIDTGASGAPLRRRLSSVGGAGLPGPRRGDRRRPLRVFLCSHDGYGLGHFRRNVLLAAALREAVLDVEATVVTGAAVDPGWPECRELGVLRMPPLLKGATGGYRAVGMDAATALEIRERLFRAAGATARPDVVLVDRHPYGTDGELRSGLELAAAQGAVLVLGLRDVLDEPGVIRDELAGPRWDGVPDLFDEVLVYGSPRLVDHEREYALPVRPHYVGWVTAPAPFVSRVPRRLAVASGGGGDGGDVFRLGVELVRRRRDWSGVVAAGPYAESLGALAPDVAARMQVATGVPGCAGLFASAEAVLQMAGYNSTVEALSAGIRPILVPRRRPRREQAIRASRLATWGLADVVDAGGGADEVDWLLDQPRALSPGALMRAGVTFDGAEQTAARVETLLAARRAA